MLKILILLIVLVFTLSACSSSTSKQGLVGSGSFDAQEAAKTRVSLGLTYLKNGNFTQAKYNLDKALEFAPRSADAHFALAYYYEQVEELTLADQYYQSALDYQPKNADILNSYGAFLCKQSKYAQAKSFFLKAVNSKNYISTAETYENLALCSQSQGLDNEALEYFNSALNHQPTRAESLFMLASLQTKLGLFAEAKKTLWKFERNASVNPESVFMSYRIARGLGDTKGALAYGDILKSMYPNHPNTAEFKRQMGKFQPVASVRQKSLIPDVSVQTPKVEKNVSGTIKDIDKQPSVSTKIDSSQNEEDESNIDIEHHIVQAKENLYRISLKYNVKMSRLMEWNNLVDSSSIKIGMKLWVKDPNTNDR